MPLSESVHQTIWWLCLAVLVGFTGFTVYASLKEDFLKSHGAILKRLWGRQLVLDIYIGLLLFHLFVYAREESMLITLCWLVPSLVLGNIVPLIYMITQVMA